jgi:GAF domain-containing protein
MSVAINGPCGGFGVRGAEVLHTALAEALAELIRGMHTALVSDPGAIWRLTTAAALRLPGVSQASITVVESDDAVRGIAPTSDAAQALDELQQRLREGPGYDAARERQVCRVDDFSRETAWPAFSREASAFGWVGAILSLPLAGQRRVRSALNLYAAQPDAFGSDHEKLALAFAADAAVAAEIARREKHLRKALTNREAIGEAKYVLMRRLSIDAATALSMLAQLSRDRHQSVSAVARWLIGPP